MLSASVLMCTCCLQAEDGAPAKALSRWQAAWACAAAVLTHEPLLTATLAGVLIGILLGGLLRYRQMSVQSIDLIGVPIACSSSLCTCRLCELLIFHMHTQ